MKFFLALLGLSGVALLSLGTGWATDRQLVQFLPESADTSSRDMTDPPHTSLHYPLPQVMPLTSGYGWRVHPITNQRRFHAGIDLGAPMGMPVWSAHSGWVVFAGSKGGYGNCIIIRDRSGQYETLYAHLSEISVRQGAAISPRQVIGRVGSTGASTGPHLHFELRKRTLDQFVAITPPVQLTIGATSLITGSPVEDLSTAIAEVHPGDDPSASSSGEPANTTPQPFTSAAAIALDFNLPPQPGL